MDDHEIYHHLPDDETAYHAGDGMEKNGGNMNGIGIEMCVNSDGNYEQTLINTERLCARLLIEHDLNPSKALKKHQDLFRAKSVRPPFINSGRWDEFYVSAGHRKIQGAEGRRSGKSIVSIRLAACNHVQKPWKGQRAICRKSLFLFIL